MWLPACSFETTNHHMTKTTILQEFKQELARLGYSKGMINTMPTSVLELLERMELKQIEDPKLITGVDIWEHYEYLQTRPNHRKKEQGLSDNMIKSHLFGIKVFFIYWQRLGRIEEHPMSALQFPKIKQKERVVLSESEISALFEVCESKKESAILGVYYGCGLRRSEGFKLNIRDISFKQGLLYVREGKRAKRRVVPMSEQVTKDLRDYYLKERNKYVSSKTIGEHEQAFFLSRIGTRMSSSSSNRMLKELLERAGLNSKVSLHNLRHSISTHLLDRGMSLEYVRDFLGHSSLETTQLYTRVYQRNINKL